MGRGMTGLMGRRFKVALKQGNILERCRKMVECGAIEEPAWYAAALEVPPFTSGPRCGSNRQRIVFPTDELVAEHLQRNPHVMAEPLSQGPHATASLSFQFACRQLRFMQQGMEREAAYEAAEREMSVEAEAKLLDNRRLIESARAVAGTGAAPAFLADEAVYMRLLEWKDFMAEKPYELWEDPPKAALLRWLMVDVMRYTDEQLKAARSLQDGTMEEIEADAQSLLHALFPGSISHMGRVFLRYRFGDPDWVVQHQAWSRRVRESPKAYKWPVDERAQLSSWILRECMDKDQVSLELNKAAQEGHADELVWEVHLAKMELLPGIRLHRLQTPSPWPQPDLAVEGKENGAENPDVSLESSVAGIRFYPYRHGARTRGGGGGAAEAELEAQGGGEEREREEGEGKEGERDEEQSKSKSEPENNWAYASIPGGAQQQARMEVARDVEYLKETDARARTRAELRKRELTNPIERVLLNAARKARRLDEATAATAFEEMRAIRLGKLEDVPAQIDNFGKSTYFERVMAAELEANPARKAKYDAEATALKEDELEFQRARRRRREARLAREAAQLAFDKAQEERFQRSTAQQPQKMSRKQSLRF